MEDSGDGKVHDDRVIQLINPFKTQQHDPVDDFNLFLGHLKKCRCCFGKLPNTAEGQSVIEESHRKAFKAFTGVELSCRDNYELHICAGCAEMLNVFNELRIAAVNVQNRYCEFIQNLTVIVGEYEDYSEPKLPAAPSLSCDLNNNNLTTLEVTNESDNGIQPRPSSNYELETVTDHTNPIEMFCEDEIDENINSDSDDQVESDEKLQDVSGGDHQNLQTELNFSKIITNAMLIVDDTAPIGISATSTTKVCFSCFSYIHDDD